MKAGRELDELILKHIFNEDFAYGAITMKNPLEIVGVSLIAPYSTDITYAWKVVEKMMKEMSGDYMEPFRHVIECTATGKIAHVVFFGLHTHMGVADTASLAICLAALKVKGVEVNA